MAEQESGPIQVFVPEYVPLENKGEEAIIRGMGDVIFGRHPVEFHILDMAADEYRFEDGFHVHPGAWFYSRWRTKEFGLGWSTEKIWASSCSLARNGLNRLAPMWVTIPQHPTVSAGRAMLRLKGGDPPRDPREEALKRIAACEYLIAGHDGALNEYDCHVIEAMQRIGMPFGVFGTSFKPKSRSRGLIAMYARTLAQAEFVYCRNPIALRWGHEHLPGIEVQLAPDPAFGMLPASEGRIDQIIASEGLGGLFSRPVVMVTPAEPAPIARFSFEEQASPGGKREAHRVLLADLIRHIVEARGLNVLFLPHSCGPGAELDDRTIARDVLARAALPPDRAVLLERPYRARDLKGLIGRAGLLVGERIHSIIGAVGVRTPFLSVGSSHDTRVTGIVGEMLQSRDAIYLLNRPSLAEACAAFDRVWDGREAHRQHLKLVGGALESRLSEIGAVMRARVQNHLKHPHFNA